MHPPLYIGNVHPRPRRNHKTIKGDHEPSPCTGNVPKETAFLSAREKRLSAIHIPRSSSTRQSRFKEDVGQDIADVFHDFKGRRPRSIAAALSGTTEEWWIRATNAVGLQSTTQLLRVRTSSWQWKSWRINEIRETRFNRSSYCSSYVDDFPRTLPRLAEERTDSADLNGRVVCELATNIRESTVRRPLIRGKQNSLRGVNNEEFHLRKDWYIGIVPKLRGLENI